MDIYYIIPAIDHNPAQAYTLAMLKAKFRERYLYAVPLLWELVRFVLVRTSEPEIRGIFREKSMRENR